MWNQNRGYWTPNLHFVTLNFAQAKERQQKKSEGKWILWVPYQKMSMRADTHKQMIDCSSVPVSQLVLSTLNANSVRAKRYHFADCRLFFSCLWCVHLRVCVCESFRFLRQTELISLPMKLILKLSLALVDRKRDGIHTYTEWESEWECVWEREKEKKMNVRIYWYGMCQKVHILKWK